MSQNVINVLKQSGRLPGLRMEIVSAYDGSTYQFTSDADGRMTGRLGVLSYSFDSNMLVPVDAFSFALMPSQDDAVLDDAIREGDIVRLYIKDEQISTGIIDQTEVEVDADSGERIMINGRDMLGQLEMQDAISTSSKPFYAQKVSFTQILTFLKQDTRIPTVELRAKINQAQLFATEPGESKLAALQRACDAMNLLIWSGPDGRLIVGQPNFKKRPVAKLILNKADPSQNNVLSMKATRDSFTIPNFVVPVWPSQGLVVGQVSKFQGVYNDAERPKLLQSLGIILPKCIVEHNPEGASPQGLADVNRITVLGNDRLGGMAKRFIARANMKELMVQAVVPGHMNEKGDPYLVDDIYDIEFDRGNVKKPMYLFHVSYVLNENGYRTSTLWFTNLNTIVADAG